MIRPWKIWLSFSACAAVLLGVMWWVSATTLRLDRARAEAQAQADLEENVRLALWRMDAMLAPLIAQESARARSAYTAFPAAEKAYGKAYNPLSSGEVLVPSPLLNLVSSNILLHFEMDASGHLTSPQVPEGNQRDLAEAQFTTSEKIEAATAKLRELKRIMQMPAAPEFVNLAKETLGAATSDDNGRVLFAVTPSPGASGSALKQSVSPVWQSWLSGTQTVQANSLRAEQAMRNDLELGARAQSVQNAAGLNFDNTFSNVRISARADAVEGPMRPVFLGDNLLVARRVAAIGGEVLQGCWVDWHVTKQWLLDGIKDLLPQARLEPIRSNGSDSHGRLLATLPVRIIPGIAASSIDPPASPMVLALILAWVCVLMAGVAMALLLRGTLSLSERRAAFVSAVTHELRTPLTTFKMYSEMLFSGMVRNESAQKEYLSRMCTEADRLHHLVENVLAYARLERGSARVRSEKLSLAELLERVRPRIVQRAELAGVMLEEDLEPKALATVVHVDVSAVEQILFNLVDNACKYGSGGDKIVHLEALLEEGKFALLRVRDHGQGISAEAAKRLFQPFSKTANEAARTVPGVGLGLALCRGLCRSLGGDLRFNSGIRGGACFELLLPVSV